MQITVLSPHCDDAAFSCGLTLQRMLLAGNSLTIVNVCTISRYAPYLIEEKQNLTRQVSELRRQEDATFVKKLCDSAGVEKDRVNLIDLQWKDVPLRWQMECEQALAPLSLPTGEIKALRNEFCALTPSNIVLAPMALGGHIDHRLVLHAARHALPVSSLVFYEDLPYACCMSAKEQISAASQPNARLPEEWLPVQNTSPGLKREYALCYSSQIAVHVADEMERYATEHGGREHFRAKPEAMCKLQTALQQGVAS